MSASVDPVTGLQWSTNIPKSLYEAEDVGIITADIDNFNAFHNKYGQDRCEDAVQHIVTLTKSLGIPTENIFRVPPNTGVRAGIRFANCLLADEIVVVLPNTSRKKLSEFAHALNENLGASPLEVKYPNLVIDHLLSLSVGFSFAPEDGGNVDSCIQKSWDCTLIAKTTGKRKAVGWNPNLRVRESFNLPVETMFKLRLEAEKKGISADQVLTTLLSKHLA